MTDRENFLERWSRKKAQAAHEPLAPATPPAQADAAPGEPAVPKPEFDLASLPSIESITKATDIRAFFTPGVPAELTRAALRRVWVADPAIRDFVGLAENAWDFTDPNAMPGFGEIAPDYDVKRLIAQLFEPSETQAAPAATKQAADAVVEAGSGEKTSANDANEQPSGDDRLENAAVYTEIVHSNNNVASHNDTTEEDHPAANPPRRRHGGALPT